MFYQAQKNNSFHGCLCARIKLSKEEERKEILIFKIYENRPTWQISVVVSQVLLRKLRKITRQDFQIFLPRSQISQWPRKNNNTGIGRVRMEMGPGFSLGRRAIKTRVLYLFSSSSSSSISSPTQDASALISRRWKKRQRTPMFARIGLSNSDHLRSYGSNRILGGKTEKEPHFPRHACVRKRNLLDCASIAFGVRAKSHRKQFLCNVVFSYHFNISMPLVASRGFKWRKQRLVSE